MVRVHSEEPNMLSDRDSFYDTITFLSDRFSTYAIVYRGSSDNPLENPNTAGSEAAAGLSILAFGFPIGAVMAVFGKSKKNSIK